MTLEEILANKSLAIHKKKTQIQKTDYSELLLDSVSKADNNGISKVEVLVYEALVKKSRNEEMFKQYLNGWVLNHSVGMRYVKILFCYNNDNPEYSQEKENYDKYISQVINKSDVEQKTYFWAVLEGKNIEGSAVVKGSNFLTPVLSVEKIDDEILRVKVAVSVSNIFDSHCDVHMVGMWKKAINENQFDLLLQEHDMDFDKVIADSINDELKVYTENISVKELISKFNNKKNNGAGTTTPKHEPSNDTQTKRRR